MIADDPEGNLNVTSGDVFVHRLKEADYGLKAVAYRCSRGGTYGGLVGHSEVSWRHLAAKGTSVQANVCLARATYVAA